MCSMSKLDHMNALLFAKNLTNNYDIMDLKGELHDYLKTVYAQGVFTRVELSKFAHIPLEEVRKATAGIEGATGTAHFTEQHIDMLIQLSGRYKSETVEPILRKLVSNISSPAVLSRGLNVTYGKARGLIDKYNPQEADNENESSDDPTS